MKFLIILLLTTMNINANPMEKNEDLYNERVKEVLNIRKKSMIKKLAIKINSSDEEIEKNTTFTRTEKNIEVLGHILGSYGVCEITGTISITETSVAGKCISENQKVTIIWP